MLGVRALLLLAAHTALTTPTSALETSEAESGPLGRNLRGNHVEGRQIIITNLVSEISAMIKQEPPTANTPPKVEATDGFFQLLSKPEHNYFPDEEPAKDYSDNYDNNCKDFTKNN